MFIPPNTEVKSAFHTKTSLALFFFFAWSFCIGRLCAFGFRPNALCWIHKRKYEGWYLLTPILYRPHQCVYLIFHVVLCVSLLVGSMLGSPNVWLHLVVVNGLFSYWHVVFLEDLVSFKWSLVLGCFILCLLGTAMVVESHTVERLIISVVAVTFIYLFVPCVHAFVKIRKVTRVTLYEGRKTRDVTKDNLV